jgi:hypothetical protein
MRLFESQQTLANPNYGMQIKFKKELREDLRKTQQHPDDEFEHKTQLTINKPKFGKQITFNKEFVEDLIKKKPNNTQMEFNSNDKISEF